jgi:Mlc titration factor MtfA (ptsG expression regulator)
MLQAADILLTPEELRGFYSSSFSYYLTLGGPYREIFVERCRQFISEKEILAAENFVLTNKVKALVAASAVQLTLGLETWKLDYFETIVIYPQAFENEESGLMHKGETNLRGFIKLSWKSFIHGYNQANDKVNLGLHEFSHALRFNAVRGAAQDYFFEHYFNNWLAAAYEAYWDIKNNRRTIFRKYGGANINEFISVCIEHYFESPEEIRQQYPLLYYSTGILLNQETNGQDTEIGIRHNLLEKKNGLLPGFSAQRYHMFLTRSPFFITTLVLLPLFLLSASASGVLSPPFFLFLCLWLLSYLRFDFRFTRLWLQDKSIRIEKGFFIFKGFRKKELPVSSLVSFGRNEGTGTVTEWKVIFYNPADTYFYEETIHAGNSQSTALLKELALNKIARLKQ